MSDTCHSGVNNCAGDLVTVPHPIDHTGDCCSEYVVTSSRSQTSSIQTTGCSRPPRRHYGTRAPVIWSLPFSATYQTLGPGTPTQHMCDHTQRQLCFLGHQPKTPCHKSPPARVHPPGQAPGTGTVTATRTRLLHVPMLHTPSGHVWFHT